MAALDALARRAANSARGRNSGRPAATGARAWRRRRGPRDRASRL